MGACHSRNHFTSSPSTSTVTSTAIPTVPFTSKSYSPARFPNPIVQVPDDRLPEFISTLHQESQCNKLQGISVAYKFNPNNQVRPFLFLTTMYFSHRVDVSFNIASIIDTFVLCLLDYPSSACYQEV